MKAYTCCNNTDPLLSCLESEFSLTFTIWVNVMALKLSGPNTCLLIVAPNYFAFIIRVASRSLLINSNQ